MAFHEGWRRFVQVLAERVLIIVRVSFFDEYAREVRPAGQAPSNALHLFELKGNAEVLDLLDESDIAIAPRGEQFADPSAELAGWRLPHKVTEHVNGTRFARQLSAQLNSADQVQTAGARRLDRLVVPGQSIVIRDCERFESHRQCAVHKLTGCRRAVRFIGVRMQIDHSASLLRRSALAITETELKVIAALAITGLSKRPKNGYKTPAAIGTPALL